MEYPEKYKKKVLSHIHTLAETLIILQPLLWPSKMARSLKCWMTSLQRMNNETKAVEKTLQNCCVYI